MARILIVDDSNFYRTYIHDILNRSGQHQILGACRNGLEAVELLKTQPIELAIIDLIMPKMDGLSLLKHIMSTNPIPTIILHDPADPGNDPNISFNALRLGALEAITKPALSEGMKSSRFEQEIIEKAKIASISQKRLSVFINEQAIKALLSENLPAMKKVREKAKKTVMSKNLVKALADLQSTSIDGLDFAKKIDFNAIAKTMSVPTNWVPPFHLIVIGASTGGPPRVMELIQNLKYSPNCAVLIIQHMPEGFTTMFATRLNTLSDFSFHEIETGMILEPGHGYVAPGDLHTRLNVYNSQIVFKTTEDDPIWGIRPSIDYTLETCIPIFKDKMHVAILTGMGNDGAINAAKAAENGAITFAQDLDEAVINSMPQAAIDRGKIKYVLKVKDMASKINSFIS